MPDRKRVLILGGTAEAAALAAALAAVPGLEAISSLAGRTRAAGQGVAGSVRLGGFGGPEGLAAYLRAERIALVVDATHPFATGISAHAEAACAAVGAPRLTLRRAPWQAAAGDRWIAAETAAAAAALLPRLGRRAFLTVGTGSVAAFAACRGAWFLVRLVDPPRRPLPLADHTVVLGRGPFTVADETALMRRHRIDVLIAKASGGPATAAKLEAARMLGLPVVMIARPPPASGPAVETVAEAVEWVVMRA